jgi:rhodanese-related sulfurtransferase
MLLFIGISCKQQNEKVSVSSSEFSDISWTDAEKVIQNVSDLVIMDVRTPEETSEGKIVNSAMELDFYADDFKDKLENLDKDATYLVYCRSGRRSANTLKMMEEQGFKKAYNLLGGYEGWLEQNK